MLLAAWLFVGLVAILATGLALATSDNGIAMVAGAIGFVTWGVWAFGAFDLVILVESTTYEYAQPTVALVGAMCAIPPGFVMLTGPVELFARARDPSPRDV